ncbi:DUF3237 domain-containing protein [Alkalibacillus haloalkaliphilus]|uniref:UPF0311 protein AHA02nite_23640 n=1 Tax=Alkalibacillus haloalkaliphilus TaxID=94136 RepID=A0A511W8B3_9BACI|nr:DUF3237 domain-containing protein [Alkalibacillus haloalkaliphilus]GEN46588.1 hypothetical protein AHA02nite_23640 [Alkalibacillus haloalkaliphilus]
MPLLPKPEVIHLFDLELTVEKPHLVGKTPVGNRQVFRVTGGAFKGERLQGNVVPGGDDWITVRDDGTVIQDVRILLETNDKQLIMMSDKGIRTGDRSVIKTLDDGVEVPIDEYYFHTAPIFETASNQYQWLNNRLFVSRGKQMAGKVIYSIYQVGELN